MEKWIMSMAVSFVLRQIAKYGASTNWALVKKDLEERVRQLVQWSWLEDAAVAILDSAIDACAAATQQASDLQHIADALVAGDLLGAARALQVLLGKVVHLPGAVGMIHALSYVK